MNGALCVGNLRRSSAQCVAETAARLLAEHRVGYKRALCCDPVGRVTLEAVGPACESDLVGVYLSEGVGRWIALAALMTGDLRLCVADLHQPVQHRAAKRRAA